MKPFSPSTDTTKKVCDECERKLPVAEFKKTRWGHAKRCNLCDGLRKRAGNPNHATRADGRIGFDDSENLGIPRKKAAQ